MANHLFEIPKNICLNFCLSIFSSASLSRPLCFVFEGTAACRMSKRNFASSNGTNSRYCCCCHCCWSFLIFFFGWHCHSVLTSRLLLYFRPFLSDKQTVLWFIFSPSNGLATVATLSPSRPTKTSPSLLPKNIKKRLSASCKTKREEEEHYFLLPTAAGKLKFVLRSPKDA